jgi:hypothetical protein
VPESDVHLSRITFYLDGSDDIYLSYTVGNLRLIHAVEPIAVAGGQAERAIDFHFRLELVRSTSCPQ